MRPGGGSASHGAEQAARCAARSPSGLGIDVGAYVVDGFSLNKLFFWLFSSFPTSSRNLTVYVRPAGRLPRPPALLPRLACCPRAAGRRAHSVGFLLRGVPFGENKTQTNAHRKGKKRKKEERKRKVLCLSLQSRAGLEGRGGGSEPSPGCVSWAVGGRGDESHRVGAEPPGRRTQQGRRPRLRAPRPGHQLSPRGGLPQHGPSAQEPSPDSADSCGSGFTAPVTGPQPQPPCSPACGALFPHWSPGSWS